MVPSLSDIRGYENPAIQLIRTLNYGNHGLFLIMCNAGFLPSTVFGDARRLRGVSRLERCS